VGIFLRSSYNLVVVALQSIAFPNKCQVTTADEL
jgi:hypothetical protein